MHRHLDGDGAAPLEWVISNVCEEFHCLPSQALREIQDGPLGLVGRIIDCRAYAHTKHLVDEAASKPDGDLEITEAVELVWDIENEIAAENACGINEDES